ncbi:MAG: creatininase family protein, partial [Anaerolineae bacterium]
RTSGIAPEGFISPIEHPSDHGGESETSRMLWIRPDLVREDKLDRFPVATLRVPTLSHVHFVRPWHHYVPASAGGETRAASAEKGQILLEAYAEGLAELLVELSQVSYDDRFPS